MSRTPLILPEIQVLSQILAGLFKQIDTIKQGNPIAKHIQNPKIPSRLTESFALHLLEKNLIIPKLAGCVFRFGGSEADILAINKTHRKKIEVKSTGHSEFQYFGPNDIASDYLIWINFGESFLRNNFSKINVIVIKDIKRYFNKPTKITLKKFKEIVGNELTEVIYDLNEL